MTKKAIVLLSEYPNPPNSGTRVKNFHFWKQFQDLNIELIILYLDDQNNRDNFSGHQEIACRYDQNNLLQKTWRYLNYSHHQYRYSSEMKAKLSDLIENWSPDILHAEELKMAKYIPTKFIKNTLTLHNVESELIKTCGSLPVPFGQSIINNIHTRNLKKYERKSVSRADLVFTYSQVDSLKLQSLYPESKIMTTQNGVNAKSINPRPAYNKNKILFIGSLHYAPNAEGLKWFLNYVHHLLFPDIEITVAGAGAPIEMIKELEAKNIIFLDNPADLKELYYKTSLCIVPILSGSGTRTKILEAQAFERLTISTHKGAEGLIVDETNGVFKADSPEEFAQKINLWSSKAIDPEGLQIAQKARQSVLENYDWSALALKYFNAWSSL